MYFTGAQLKQSLKLPTGPFFSDDRKYLLAKIALVRAACPVELQASFTNASPNLPIIIEKNRYHHGQLLQIAYKPNAVVAAGAAKRTRLLEQGEVFAYALVEKDSMPTTDEVTAGELLEKLQNGVSRKFYGERMAPMAGQPWVGVSQVHPLNDRVVVDVRGSKYFLNYELSPKKEVSFISAAAEWILPINQTGQRYYPGSVPAEKASPGAPMCDLVMMIVRNHTNINEAVDAYVKASKEGLYKPMRPAFCPVQLSNDGKIQQALTAKGIDPFEFARWTAQSAKPKIWRGAQVEEMDEVKQVNSKVRM